MTYRERTFQHIAEFTSDVTVRVPQSRNPPQVNYPPYTVLNPDNGPKVNYSLALVKLNHMRETPQKITVLVK
jgi:hypothetical protein